MFLEKLSEWFPTPRLLYPHSVGLDITDSSVKWLELAPYKSGYKVLTSGFIRLEEGIVVNGAIQNTESFIEALRQVKKEWRGSVSAHAALPEEGAYVFSMHVPPKATREQILSMIEFEFEGRVPLKPDQAAYDFDIVSEHDTSGVEIAVVIFQKDLAARYVECCAAAGIELMSMELEARSIARAVSPIGEESPAELLADFGRERTGFAIIKNGVPIFTTTVGVGGKDLTKALVEKLGFTEDQARDFKNTQGLLPAPGAEPATEAATGIAAALSDEILQHYHFWNTRRDEHGERATPLAGVLLVGGSANMKGIVEYVAGRVKAPVERPNVWKNVCSFDEYIPPIHRRISLQYATAIGLALRSIV